MATSTHRPSRAASKCEMSVFTEELIFWRIG